MTCRVGALEFSLYSHWHSRFDTSRAVPFLLLPTGEEFSRLRLEGVDYLVIDHRARPDLVSRIELWLSSGTGEGSVGGLLVLGDSKPVVEGAGPAA